MGKELKREREDREKAIGKKKTKRDSHRKDTKRSELFMTRLKWMSKSMEGRTSVRCKDLGRVVNRGERLSKLRDSLFFTKAVEAVPVRGRTR